MYGMNYNPQIMNYDRQIQEERNKIAELERQKVQAQFAQPTNLTQNFQLAPTNHTMKFASTIDDVNREVVYFDTPFFSKDMSVMWIKSTKGDIRSYELNEIIPKDAKDLQIEYLQAQIDEMKKEMKRNDANATNGKDVDAKQSSADTTTVAKSNGDELKSNKSSSIPAIPGSEEE